MNPDESSYPGELADSDLDRLLVATNKELLAHIEAAADPTPTLIALITRDTPAGPDDTASFAASGRDETEDTKAHQPPREISTRNDVPGSRYGELNAGRDVKPAPGLALTAYGPSVLTSVEAAVSTVARSNLLARLWHWRYELALSVGLPLAAFAIGSTGGLRWLFAVAAATTAILAAALTWPTSRQALIARAWCVITPHRVRTGCAHALVQTRDGRLPTVLYTAPTEFGERVMLWCRAGITPEDFEGARDILRAACWASDVQVVVNDRRSHIVVLEVIRRLPVHDDHA
jgi:hypothetical protein